MFFALWYTMGLLNGYTIGFVDNLHEKVEIDFLNPKPSKYELSEFSRFFRKKERKKETYVNFVDGGIRFIITHYKFWAQFLVKLGFRGHAIAVLEILEELHNMDSVDITPEEWFKMHTKARIVRPEDKKSVIKDRPSKKRYEELKSKEVEILKKMKRDRMPVKKRYFGQCDRLRETDEGEENWRNMMKNKKRISQGEFERNVNWHSFTVEESIDDFIADDPGSSFYVSVWGEKLCYFVRTCGFEFIFI